MRRMVRELQDVMRRMAQLDDAGTRAAELGG